MLPIAIQLYSVRDDAAADMRGTLQKIREMGYDGVEFAGLHGHTAEEVREMCQEIGLLPLSAHVPYDEMVADPEGVLGQYAAIGCRYVAIPYLMPEYRPGTPGFADVIRNAAMLGEVANRLGMTLLYHNHDFEFQKIDGKYALEVLYDTVPASLLQTELDVCWVRVGGEEPAAYIRKYTGRAPVVHLKDFYKEGKQANMDEVIGIATEKKKETGKFEFRPVGHGMQNIPPVLDAALEAGSKWVVVEQDQSYDTPALEAVKMSRDYLKGLGW